MEHHAAGRQPNTALKARVRTAASGKKLKRMTAQTFINLPVKDLNRTVEFFTGLGFTFNPQFTNENATAMIINDNTFVMLLVEPFFAGFTTKPVANAHASTEVLICLSAESRQAVEDMVSRALAGGGKAEIAAKDHGWMYQHGFEDPDGHMWEIAFMDESQFPGNE